DTVPPTSPPPFTNEAALANDVEKPAHEWLPESELAEPVSNALEIADPELLAAVLRSYRATTEVVPSRWGEARWSAEGEMVLNGKHSIAEPYALALVASTPTADRIRFETAQFVVLLWISPEDLRPVVAAPTPVTSTPRAAPADHECRRGITIGAGVVPEILERRDAWARIRVAAGSRGGVAVSGWIPEAALRDR